MLQSSHAPLSLSVGRLTGDEEDVEAHRVGARDLYLPRFLG